jgi:hypothetical protein
MRHKSHVPFVFALDGSQPVEQLVRMLTVALDGERPVQHDCPDADHFVEGSVEFRDAEVRVRLNICAFADCRVIHSWCWTYAAALGETIIAGLIADALEPHFKQLCGLP